MRCSDMTTHSCASLVLAECLLPFLRNILMHACTHTGIHMHTHRDNIDMGTDIYTNMGIHTVAWLQTASAHNIRHSLVCFDSYSCSIT